MCARVFVENDDSALDVGNKIFVFSRILNQMGSKHVELKVERISPEFSQMLNPHIAMTDNYISPSF